MERSRCPPQSILLSKSHSESMPWRYATSPSTSGGIAQDYLPGDRVTTLMSGDLATRPDFNSFSNSSAVFLPKFYQYQSLQVYCMFFSDNVWIQGIAHGSNWQWQTNERQVGDHCFWRQVGDEAGSILGEHPQTERISNKNFTERNRSFSMGQVEGKDPSKPRCRNKPRCFATRTS